MFCRVQTDSEIYLNKYPQPLATKSQKFQQMKVYLYGARKQQSKCDAICYLNKQVRFICRLNAENVSSDSRI